MSKLDKPFQLSPQREYGGSLYGKNDGSEAIQSENESAYRNIEDNFVNEVVRQLMDVLKITAHDSRIVRPLLKETIGKNINSPYKNKGLLQQYGMYILDKAAERFHNTLDIPENIKVDHNYADHAKYASIVEYIDKNFITIKEHEEIIKKLKSVEDDTKK